MSARDAGRGGAAPHGSRPQQQEGNFADGFHLNLEESAALGAAELAHDGRAGMTVATGAAADGNYVEKGVRSPDSMKADLSALAAHIARDGFDFAQWADVTVHARGRSWHLHRIILSRSPFFKAMLTGDWAEREDKENLHLLGSSARDGATVSVPASSGASADGAADEDAPGGSASQAYDDDDAVDADGLEQALAFLYGRSPSLSTSSAPHVMAAACYLQLDELAEMCCDFIVNDDMSHDTVLTYQTFIDSRDYGRYGDYISRACLGCLCTEVGPRLHDLLLRLPAKTVRKVLESNELHVLDEITRFSFAMEVLRSRYDLLSIAMRSGGDPTAVDSFAAVADIAASLQKVDIDGGDGSVGMKDDAQSFGGLFVPPAHANLPNELPVEEDHPKFERGSVWHRCVDEEVEYMSKLFRSGIHYAHMSCDDLFRIKEEMRASPIKWLANASWPEEGLFDQMRLRTKILQLNSGSDGGGVDVERTASGSSRSRSISGEHAQQREPPNEHSYNISNPRECTSGGSPSPEPPSVNALGSPSAAAISVGPFRFGVELANIHDLTDGQSRQSREVYYGGSMWKVSVQAFSNEDPKNRQRRTLGVFLHRRRAEEGLSTDQSYFVDYRETVFARYKLAIPCNNGVYTFGTLSRRSKMTSLPPPPKGWGWRSALLFDEIDHVVNAEGNVKITAAIQLAF